MKFKEAFVFTFTELRKRIFCGMLFCIFAGPLIVFQMNPKVGFIYLFYLINVPAHFIKLGGNTGEFGANPGMSGLAKLVAFYLLLALLLSWPFNLSERK